MRLTFELINGRIDAVSNTIVPIMSGESIRCLLVFDGRRVVETDVAPGDVPSNGAQTAHSVAPATRGIIVASGTPFTAAALLDLAGQSSGVERDVPLTAGDLTRSHATVVADDGVHDLALHEVLRDSDTECRYADVTVDTDWYRPFLHLVVARYQPDARAGQTLSDAVAVDAVRLGVGRSVSVRVVDTGWAVLVTGSDRSTGPGTTDEVVYIERVELH